MSEYYLDNKIKVQRVRHYEHKIWQEAYGTKPGRWVDGFIITIGHTELKLAHREAVHLINRLINS
jgi:hypothetical protein